MKALEIREKFNQYFIKRDHKKWLSCALIPYKDPSLLFVNSGMVQFKDIFLGKIKPKNRRVITIQKCLRAGGKHNDLEQVGFTPRHHTFFEMLGNFSFGDYFKEEAISYAWEFLTHILKIQEKNLFISVHTQDEESKTIWLKKIGVPTSRLFLRGNKENFWEMGETGPCGPCSEIFFDHGSKYGTYPKSFSSPLPLENESRFVEIWNLVFMQSEKYKENEKIKERRLSASCIDTGAGLERIAALLQGVYSNYHTDLFQEIISKVKEHVKKSFLKKENEPSFHVIADHARAATMLITDGVIPSNEEKGYVLRRIIRRAIRHLDFIGIKEPFLFSLVETVFKSLGLEYPENAKNKEMAIKYLETEEQNFRKTLSSGLKILEKEIEKIKTLNETHFSGETAFHLYDTHGFPLDLTQSILKEKNLKVDKKKFESEMKKQKERSKKHSHFLVKKETLNLFNTLKDQLKDTRFKGYSLMKCEAKLLKKIHLNEKEVGLIFDQTPFYAEAGGQTGDNGWILKNKTPLAKVKDTISPVEGLYVHVVGKDEKKIPKDLKQKFPQTPTLEGLKEKETYSLQVNEKRRFLIAKNHTATHLLHAALRKVLGTHVKQAGSAVKEHSLRFDFSHPRALTQEEISQTERLVNLKIFEAWELKTLVMKKDQALSKGALALFGEKYSENVRVIEVENFSLELCGGTHVRNTSEVHFFKITSETALAKGVRRMEALTSELALKKVNQRLINLENLEQALQAKGEMALERTKQLKKIIKTKEKEIKTLKENLQAEKSKSLFKNPKLIKNGMVFKMISVEEESDLRKISDLFLNQYQNGLIFIHSKNEKRSSLLLRVSKKNKTIDCQALLNKALTPLEGRSGGNTHLAQGSVETKKLDQLKKNIEHLIH